MRAQQYSPIGSLLMDIATIFLFNDVQRLFSRDIVAVLNIKEGRPWCELRRGKKVDESWLAAQLRPYEITPRTMRIGPDLAKGYLFDDFKEVLRRYVPKGEIDAFKADLEARVVKKETPPTEQKVEG